MKRNIFMFAAAFAIALAGCADDELIDKGIPVKTGDEIIFASMLNGDQNVIDVNNAGTRTVYGDRDKLGIAVNWSKGDQIGIFCPQASAPDSRFVDYQITPDSKNPAQSGSMVKVHPEQAGLQWGTDQLHKFFGIYPASIVKETDADDKGGTITATLPTTQMPIGWKHEKMHIPGVGEKTVHYAGPNMNYSFMFAYKGVTKEEMTTNKAISLEFQNLVTVLDIVIQGPETGEVAVTNVNVDVVKGQNVAICGDFKMKVDKYDDTRGHIDCEAIPSDKVTDRISIPCYETTDGKNQFIKLGPDDVLVVKAFIIPDTHTPESFRQFRITVSMLNGSANRMTLNRADLGETVNRVIVPHKINRILLPPLKPGEPAQWLSNLDPNIYLTELSIPGSKMSYLTANNHADPVFQTKTIPEQFKDGIRAFIVQTGVQSSYDYSWWKNKYTLDKTKPITMPIVGAGNGKQLEQTLDEIIKSIENAKKERPDDCNEFAFLLLTADFSYNNTNHGHFDDFRIWMEGAAEKLKALKNDPYYGKYIYTDEITANTVLGDVKGKIVIKVNYNSNDQHKWVSSNDRVPALFSLWEAPPSPYKLISTPLYWGTLNAQGIRAPMQWMYQEVTNIPKEASEEAKIEGVLGLFKEGVKAYKENTAHDTWFMNDLGGAYRNVDGTLQQDPTTRIAKKFNQVAIDALQKRTENASTGLVFMNFADRDPESGGLYKSDYIIATIIDNNFKFALRKRASSSAK